MNSFQEIFGPPSAGAANKVVDYMTDWVQNYIRHAPFAVLASADADGNCDASPKGGKPGFIKVLDDRHLLIPDVAGNRLFQSYDNMSQNPRIGLLFLIPGVDSTARVNGRVELFDKAAVAAKNMALEIFNPDEEAKVTQGLLLTVEESYGHCPRALKFSNLWDAETIGQNKAAKLP
ncbi:MAG: pyridoxamine 5'-phosphate oxidase family protein [Caldilineaceae bacterium]